MSCYREFIGKATSFQTTGLCDQSMVRRGFVRRPHGDVSPSSTKPKIITRPTVNSAEQRKKT